MRFGDKESLGKDIFATTKWHDLKEWILLCPPDTEWTFASDVLGKCEKDNITEDFNCVIPSEFIIDEEVSSDALRKRYNDLFAGS